MNVKIENNNKNLEPRHSDSVRREPNATDERRNWGDNGKWRQWIEKTKVEKAA